MSVNKRSHGAERSGTVEERLGHLTPRARQAFLLVAVEGFSESDAAQVLEVDTPTLRHLVEEAGRELAAEIATDVMIIEDEPLIAFDLEGLVESLGHRVLGVARTHAEAIALAKAKRPGLILADIQLADGSSGLDAVNELLKAFEVPVDVHHRLSGTVPDRRTPGAGLPDRQAVPAGDGLGHHQSGAVLRAQGKAARARVSARTRARGLRVRADRHFTYG